MIAPSEPTASVARWAKEARMFRLSPWARCTRIALPAFTSRPRVAIATRPPPATGVGSRSLATLSTMIQPPAASSITALTWAASTSARAKPKLWRALTGRAASTSAPSAMPSPATSETRCTPSASSAREPNTNPPMTSTTSSPVLTPNAQDRARR